MRDCIEHHTIYRSPEGYARENHPITGDKANAHRVAWIKTNGDISEDLVVRHKCDNPACVNLEHLELGSHLDNARDRVVRGRCGNFKGTRNPNSKINKEDVLFIRASAKVGTTLIELHEVYPQLNKKYIRQLMNGQHWRSVA